MSDFGDDKQEKKKQTLHIAHRRTPSELTPLMVEQLNIQRQLEIQKQLDLVEQQKKHLLAQQQQINVFQPPLIQNISPPNSHRRTQSSGTRGSAFSMPNSSPSSSSNPQFSVNPTSQSNSFANFNSSSPSRYNYGHSKAASTNLSHSRRHSLGLQEAKKAAALAQSQRNGNSPPSSASPSSSFKTPEIDQYKAFKSFSPSPQRNSVTNPRDFQFPSLPGPSSISNTDNSNLLLPPQISYSGSPVKKHERNSSGSFRNSPSRGGSHSRKSSGHFRSNSRNNKDWRNPGKFKENDDPEYIANPDYNDSGLLAPPATFGHQRNKSSISGAISSINTIASYGGGSSNNHNNQQRKSLFSPYLPQASLPELIALGKLVIGTLRVNKKNRSDAYVSTDGLLDADIFISGSKDRNRALEGDLVAVELLVVDEVWNSRKEKEEKKRQKSFNDNSNMEDTADTVDTSNDASVLSNPKEGSSIKRRGSLKQRPLQKKNDDLEVEGQSLLLVEEDEINDEYKPLYAGHVVAVIDRIPCQLFAGTLGLLRPSQQRNNNNNFNNNNNMKPKIVWFKPTDKKVPLIAIPTEQAPNDFVENHELYSNKLFVASIKRWPITSLHPFGTLISELGPIDDRQTEIDAILKDNNFSCDEFPNDTMQYITEPLPQDLLYLLNDINPTTEVLEKENRRSFLKEYTIGISPINKNCDFAMHVKKIDDTKLEIGVHIADVESFIKQGSTLDKKLKKRSVSVNIVQGNNAPFLPDLLSQIICFKDNSTAATVSVIFEVSTNGFLIEDVWMGEGIIKPKQIITYDEVDQILTNNSKSERITEATSNYVRTLSIVSKEFMRQRLNDSKLEQSPQLTLLNEFDEERINMTLNIFDDNFCFPMIEEFVHKVNLTVAQKVFAKLGSRSFLRRQQLPTLSKYETFIKRVSSLNLDVDTTSSASLQCSILNIKDDAKRKVVETLLSKCMHRGKYYIAGKVDPETYEHWFYNLPLYTHFTSPASRYADIIVHRQLKSVLYNTAYLEEADELKLVADYCNFKKDSSLAAQYQSIHLLLCQTVNAMSEKSGHILTIGTVIQVYESSFDVLLPEFGIEKRVHGDQLPLIKAEFDSNKSTLELYWEKGVDSATFIPVDETKPLSYRSSIKNKFRTSSSEAAKLQVEEKNENYEYIMKQLEELKLKAPEVIIPSKSVSVNSAVDIKNDRLAPYFKDVTVKIDKEKDYYIQEIKSLTQVPILLRSEIGMALPCLTVRTLNPFANYE